MSFIQSTSNFYVSLNFTPGVNRVCLRELNGFDETSVDGTGTESALQLLDRLLVKKPDTNLGEGMAGAITTADRDRLLVAIYQKTYGNRIESTLPCSACQEPFDLNFTLSELQSFIHTVEQEVPVKQMERGIYELENGSRFRLPRGEDEYAILGQSTETAEKMLLDRCLLDPSEEGDLDLLQQAMSQLAPVFETELAANCPECGHHQMIHFDLQTYLLTALRQEKKRIALEVHRLARAYGWSHQELLSLPRSLRRTYLSYIMAELES